MRGLPKPLPSSIKVVAPLPSCVPVLGLGREHANVSVKSYFTGLQTNKQKAVKNVFLAGLRLESEKLFFLSVSSRAQHRGA